MPQVMQTTAGDRAPPAAPSVTHGTRRPGLRGVLQGHRLSRQIQLLRPRDGGARLPVQRDPKKGAPGPNNNHAPPSKKAPHEDQSVPGIFLVGWTGGQVAELLQGLAAFAGVKGAWDAKTYRLSFAGVDDDRMKARIAEQRWSQEMHEKWVEALKSKKHTVVLGTQKNDVGNIRGGVFISKKPAVMALDMMDMGTFKGETTRVEQSANIFWVMTHEMLGHFYLGLSHDKRVPDHKHGGTKNEKYESYDIKTYRYSTDETLKKMNQWRIELGLPVRLQHPPRIEGKKRTYVFVDAYPKQPAIDPNAKKPDKSVKLPPIDERKKAFAKLRAKMQNKLSRPKDLDVQYYPEVHFEDDDSDDKGNRLPGRGVEKDKWLLPDLKPKDSKAAVLTAKKELRKKGFQGFRLNRKYDDAMVRAVEAFKKSKGLPWNKGIIDKQTWEALLGYPIATKKDQKDREAGIR